MDRARHHCEEILGIDPAHAEALNLNGVISCQLGDAKAGIVFIAKAAAAEPDNASFLNNLGTGLSALDRDQDALLTYLRALELDPQYPTAHNNIATIYRNTGDLEKAAAHYEIAIKLRPDYAEAMSNFGNVLLDLGRVEEAADIVEQAIACDPGYVFSYNNLGIVRQRQGRYSEAEELLQKCIQLSPNFADAYANLAEVCKETGRADQAVPYYLKSLNLAPDRPSVHSNYVYALNNLDQISPHEVTRAHSEWNRIHGSAAVTAVQQKAPTDRKIRVGYVSSDFRQHSVSYFLEPIFQNHDKKQFEIFCYSTGHIEDHVTERLRAHCDQWRSIYMRSDCDACDIIRNDQIDILIDLAGHTMGNRLPLFTLKPAPVQVSYLGYPATTGLDAMDYRLTDAVVDPVGQTEEFHSEKLARIEGGFLCYQAPQNTPEIVPRPSLENGFITFGSCNNLAKVTPRVIEAWAAILREVPTANMLLKGKALGDETVRSFYMKAFSDQGVSADRLDLRAWISGSSHLSVYHLIDIALDPFPYNGTTTICETLWMGVPTVTLAGDWHAARVGLSLNSMAGFPELVAPDLATYKKIAVDLAKSPERLDGYRHTGRETMAASRLCSGREFTRAFENALRKCSKGAKV